MTNRVVESPVRDWTVQDTFTFNGLVLTPGTRLSILRERGSFTFLRYVTRPDGHCWVDVIGGAPGTIKYRSFRPDRIASAT